MSSRARRLVLVVMGAVLAWYAVVLVAWAVRPLEDSVPIGNLAGWERAERQPGDTAAPQPVGAGVGLTRDLSCSTLFDSDAIEGPPPSLPFPQVYNRPPCELPHGDARRVFVVDTAVVLLVLAGGAVVLARWRLGGEGGGDGGGGDGRDAGGAGGGTGGGRRGRSRRGRDAGGRGADAGGGDGRGSDGHDDAERPSPLRGAGV